MLSIEHNTGHRVDGNPRLCGIELEGVRRSVLQCEWRYLSFFNFAVPPSVLQPYVPAHTELDLWQGAAWLSLVGTISKNSRFLGFSIPGQQDYEQIDLRFYVRRRNRHPGVVFVKEVIGKPLVALAARTFLNQQYVFGETERRLRVQKGKLKVCYSWRSNRMWNSFCVSSDNRFEEVDEDSSAAFFAQRLWSYTKHSQLRTLVMHIEHPPWRIAPVNDSSVILPDDSVFGPVFTSILQKPADICFVAEGSPVRIRSLQRVT